ncbi:MAG: adenylate/guanylate cyclase domain-containing protein [Anaerolineales bacterium]
MLSISWGLDVADPTFRPSVEEHMARMSRSAEELRAKLALAEVRLERAGHHLPEGVLESLRQMSGTLLVIQQTVEARERERRGLSALAQIGQVINSSLELDVVLTEVIDTLVRLTGAQRVFMMLRDESGSMETVAARNWERESLDDLEIEFSRTIVDRVQSSGEAILTTNAQSDPRFGGNESIIAYNLTSILCVPLKVKGKLIGVIYADNKVKEAQFSERERQLISAFANQAAVALENARLFESVRQSLVEVTDLKDFMEDVFASVASGVITADLESKVTLVNRAAERILGQTRDKLLGEPLSGTLPMLNDQLANELSDVQAHDRRHVGVEVTSDLPGRGQVTINMSLGPLKSAEHGTRGVAIVLEDLTERRHLEAQRRLFERMVSPAVIDQLDPDSLELGGEVREITTLFADLRGFTSFSETVDPQELVSVLNRYLAAAAEAVLAEEGTIDKFMGDAVMAWFNAPVPQADHAMRAVRAARDIRRSIGDLHPSLDPQFRLTFRIGIHTGDALLGLVGSQARLDYTAIGDSVNTAKRLQENAELGQILVSSRTLERLEKRPSVRPVEGLVLEGKQRPVEVFELLDDDQAI